MERTQSNALWPSTISVGCPYGTNISTDQHETEAHAVAVVILLKEEGYAGERKVFPIVTWISESTKGGPPPKAPLPFGLTDTHRGESHDR